MGLSSASLAGLEAVQLVSETTAAALAYAHDREGTKTVIIVDIGGGGGCVSFAKVNDGAVFVLTTCGKRLPGGEDFDAKMVTHLRQVNTRPDQKGYLCSEANFERFVHCKHNAMRGQTHRRCVTNG